MGKTGAKENRIVENTRVRGPYRGHKRTDGRSEAPQEAKKQHRTPPAGPSAFLVHGQLYGARRLQRPQPRRGIPGIGRLQRLYQLHCHGDVGVAFTAAFTNTNCTIERRSMRGTRPPLKR